GVSWVTARSGRPSRSKSPTARAAGAGPTSKLAAGWNVPSPLPARKLRLLSDPSGAPVLATTRSGAPAWLKSAVTIPAGVGPTGRLTGPAKLNRVQSSRVSRAGLARPRRPRAGRDGFGLLRMRNFIESPQLNKGTG